MLAAKPRLFTQATGSVYGAELGRQARFLLRWLYGVEPHLGVLSYA